MLRELLLKTNLRLGMTAVVITCLLFASGYANFARAEAVTLTVTVASSLTFTSGTNLFGTLTPGTYKFATTTLSVTTNNVAGWNITLSGDDQSPTNGVMDLDSDASVDITDQAEWVPATATTSASNGVVRSSLDNSGNVLAFRAMSASSTNGASFLATTWWGTTDVDGTAKWAGIPSSTIQRQIGNAGTGSYSTSAHLNTILYYLNVASSQQTGAYSGGLTYTATAN